MIRSLLFYDENEKGGCFSLPANGSSNRLFLIWILGTGVTKGGRADGPTDCSLL
ncbi:hypothetical protein BBR47_47810 [Brevibacillus brevis NBRC 100599]|uniref:Uncharacterized protein n=1 Tax=Brevibacillus brevis (strain 47 / JCM 6285 / NBRC 100599) TaxID=358681 RepID=C0ZKT1_BREBN|nr:hypothetical protein BBR47_47810 [Brevibacillus brevis NBRC 100599]